MHEPPENDKGYVFVEVYVYGSKPHAHPVGKVCGLMHGLATGFYFYRALQKAGTTQEPRQKVNSHGTWRSHDSNLAGNKKATRIESLFAACLLAEEVRFELTDGCPSPVFKTGAIDHSATLPQSSDCSGFTSCCEGAAPEEEKAATCPHQHKPTPNQQSSTAYTSPSSAVSTGQGTMRGLAMRIDHR